MIRLLIDKVGVAPISDPNTTEGKPNYTAKEKEALGPDFKETGSGSLIIPDEAKERADQGIVKYVGPKVKYVKVGDYVLFSGYTGTTVQFAKDADGTIIIFREPFITAILDNPDTDVKGLYFKSKPDYIQMQKEISDILGRIYYEDDEVVLKVLSVFKFHDPYFTATYEMAMNLIAQAFKDTSFAKTTGFKDSLAGRPAPHEYNMMHEMFDQADTQEEKDLIEADAIKRVDQLKEEAGDKVERPVIIPSRR